MNDFEGGLAALSSNVSEGDRFADRIDLLLKSPNARIIVVL
jgi:hypothetical protein